MVQSGIIGGEADWVYARIALVRGEISSDCLDIRKGVVGNSVGSGGAHWTIPDLQTRWHFYIPRLHLRSAGRRVEQFIHSILMIIRREKNDVENVVVSDEPEQVIAFCSVTTHPGFTAIAVNASQCRCWKTAAVAYLADLIDRIRDRDEFPR